MTALDEVVTEAEVLAAICKADRYVLKDGHTLQPNTSALAEIWGVMIYERASLIAVSRLSAKQLAALQASRQQELLGDEGVKSCPTP